VEKVEENGDSVVIVGTRRWAFLLRFIVMQRQAVGVTDARHMNVKSHLHQSGEIIQLNVSSKDVNETQWAKNFAVPIGHNSTTVAS
jgi:hypothetical protein